MSIESFKYIRTVLQKIFKEIDLDNTNSTGYVKVKCPFHYDNTASATINPDDGFFKCFAGCGSENGLQFKDFLGLYLSDVFKLQGTDAELFNLTKDILNDQTQSLFERLEQDKLINHPNEMFRMRVLGITDNHLIEQLGLAYSKGWLFSIPVKLDDVILGYKYYTDKPSELTNNSKSKATSGLKNGIPIPYNLYTKDSRPILICEGEKDMLIARQLGYNAICFTGGCKAIPRLYGESFRNRSVVIAYDNDKPGKQGAISLGNFLLKYTKEIKVVDSFHQYLKEKEDLWDFFMKYKHTPEEFNALIQATDNYTYTEIEREQKIPLVPFSECEKPENYGKNLRSYIQIRAEGQTPQSIPKGLTIYFKNNNISINKEFHFDEQPMFFMIEYLNQTSAQLKGWIKAFIVPYLQTQDNDLINFEFVAYKPSKEHITIYTAIPTAYNEQNNVEETNSFTTMTVYSTTKLHTSQVYAIDYTTYSSPTRKHFLSILVKNAEQSNQSFKTYHIDNETEKIVQAFSSNFPVLKLNELYKRMKSRIPYLNYDLWLAYELTFNSCFSFKFNNNSCRGTVYTNVIGDTRVGKSKLGQELVALYRQGKFINAKLTTVDALVGGTDKQGDNTYIKAGVLPRNNESLLVLEELHGLGNDYFKKITEIKSSGKVSINRVSGELSLPCVVRLIEISNPKLDSTNSADSVRMFNNGVQAIRNLIHNPEDIARNDMYMIIAKPDSYDYGELEHKQVNVLPLLDKELYQNKIKWVWSRKEHQIIYEDESYFITKAKELQKLFDCDGLGIMGAEAPEKLARLSIALAGMLVSTDETRENLIVKKSHIDYITSWIIKIYSSDIMRINEYVASQREYNIYNPETDLAALNNIYKLFPEAVEFIAQSNAPNKHTLMSYMGDASKNVSQLLTQLAKLKFIKQDGEKIIATIKFRQSWKAADKNYLQQLIEPNLVR